VLTATHLLPQVIDVGTPFHFFQPYCSKLFVYSLDCYFVQMPAVRRLYNDRLSSSSSLHGLGESPVLASSIVVSLSMVFLVHLYLVFRIVDIVTYRGFYSRWKFISVPKAQHTTVKYSAILQTYIGRLHSAMSHTRLLLHDLLW
jgi:hypothetical protein